MTGKSCKFNPKNRDMTICMHNLSSYLTEIYNKHGFDILALQEATNYEQLEQINPIINDMDRVLHPGSNNEDQILYYNPYKLTVANVYFTQFSPGRPITVVVFKEGITVVNVHAGHKEYNGIYNLATLLKNKLSGKVIILGDMNNKMDKDLIIDGEIYNGKTRLDTCCSMTPRKNKLYHKYDHILTNWHADAHREVLYPGEIISDHVPVWALIDNINIK